VNARKALANFLRRARKQLLIYDPEISDEEMIRILNERRNAGVEVRVIGEVFNSNLSAGKFKNLRLHTRTIMRDGRQAFIGSQSLRGAELDSRREVGLIVRELKAVRRLVGKFESDWQSAQKNAPKRAARREEAKIDPEKVERVLIEELHPVTTTVKRAVKKVVERAGEEVLEDEIVKDTVKKVVKGAIKQAVKSAENTNP
jgi:phosphatidylserine/phosphatidylglycerophosphate/cardiolipin synthase-like enzyme